ncbi:MAG: hypothetical protein QF363_21010 [Planctomycetaceae bacterium]|jgi:hypothetical protein|nr:hypothetical protein [Planctomycetaceae bacterium]
MSQIESDSGQPRGVFKDVKRLQTDGTASVEELREFLERLKGKSPQEMLGIVAESGLVKGMVTATIGTMVVLLVFTIGPWAYGELAGEPVQPQTLAKPAPATTPNPQAAIDPATQAAAAAASVADPGSQPPAAASGQPDLGAATKALGIGETKTGEPNLDSLLDKKLDD